MRFILLTLLTFSSSTALANPNDMLISQPLDERLEHDSSSEANRHRESIELAYGVSGYTFGFFATPDWILELTYSGLAVQEDTQRWSQAVSFRARKFRGNSFYWYGGLTGREWGSDEEHQHPDRSTGFVDVGLGNQWQWRYLTLGCDWLQASVPVFREVHVPSDTSVPGRQLAMAPRGLGGVEWSALRLYAGISF